MTKKITDPSPKVVLGYKKTGNTKNFPKKMLEDPIISQFSKF